MNVNENPLEGLLGEGWDPPPEFLIHWVGGAWGFLSLTSPLRCSCCCPGNYRLRTITQGLYKCRWKTSVQGAHLRAFHLLGAGIHQQWISVIGQEIQGANSQQHWALMSDPQRTLTLEQVKSVSFPLIPLFLFPLPSSSSHPLFPLSLSLSVSVPTCLWSLFPHLSQCAHVCGSLDDWVRSCPSLTTPDFSPFTRYYNRQLFSDYNICCWYSIKLCDSCS